MTTPIVLSCNIDLQQVGPASDSTPLHLAIKLNDSVVWESNIVDAQQVTVPLAELEDDQKYTLSFVMSGKVDNHTIINPHGDIVRDVSIAISNLSIDEIELAQVFYDQSVYRHNFNGNGGESEHKFYGTMGCNGSVSLEFTTPFYLWLLENM